MIAHGIVISRIRYCLSVYGVEGLRLESNQQLSGLQHDVQKVQNNVLRILTGHKRSEHVRIADMLESTNILSVNQLTAYESVMEMWKARAFDVPVLGNLIDQGRGDERTLRSDSLGTVKSVVDEPFAKICAKLWNMSSDSFKSTNLLVIAKREAKKLARSLPI